MQIKELGHVVLYVTDLNKMVDFYGRILGFKLVGKTANVAGFSAGRTHHELLLIDIGSQYQKSNQLEPGLYHIGFKIGDEDEDLSNAIASLQTENVLIVGSADHTVTKSIYILDPDGNELELYIDTKVDWKNNPELFMVPAKPLRL